MTEGREREFREVKRRALLLGWMDQGRRERMKGTLKVKNGDNIVQRMRQASFFHRLSSPQPHLQYYKVREEQSRSTPHQSVCLI